MKIQIMLLVVFSTFILRNSNINEYDHKLNRFFKNRFSHITLDNRKISIQNDFTINNPYKILKLQDYLYTTVIDTSISKASRIRFIDDFKDIVFTRTIIINKGGVYTGNYESNDHTVPAVEIRTSEKVVLKDCITKSVATHINIPNNGHVEVLGHKALGLCPSVDNVPRGRFVEANNVKTLKIENCHIEQTSGIYIHASTPDEIKILYNYVKNIDGRHRDNKSNSVVQFVQFDKVQKANNTVIAWNYVVNEPYESFVTDNISTFASSGVENDPIKIHNNLIWGGYPVDPVNDMYTGGGILLGDYLASDGNDPDKCAAFIYAYDNVVISTTNYGMAIAGGKNHKLYNNIIISSGMLPDGRKIKSQNVGIYVWNGDKESIIFENNSAYSNIVGWMNSNDSRSDWWLPHCYDNCHNIRYLGQLRIGRNIELKFVDEYLKRASNKGIVIGP